MQKQLQLVFNHLEPSDGLKEVAAAQLEKLESMNSDITSCHIVFSSEPNNLFSVTIELQSMHKAFETAASDSDAYSALRQAFKKSNRVLQDHAGKQRAGRHDPQPAIAVDDSDFEDDEAAA
jgi:ribosomal subunit interface protein